MPEKYYVNFSVMKSENVDSEYFYDEFNTITGQKTEKS